MDTVIIRQKLHEYINIANDEKVEAIYTILKDDFTENKQWWQDEELVTELERRSEDLKSGKDKGFTLEQSKEHLIARMQKND